MLYATLHAVAAPPWVGLTPALGAMNSEPPTERKSAPENPWLQFGAACIIAPIPAWLLGFLPPIFYLSALMLIWLLLLYWVLTTFARSRTQTVKTDVRHSLLIGLALCIAMAITCWIPVTLTFTLRHDLQFPAASALAPNNSFKPTPHRGVSHVPALR